MAGQRKIVAGGDLFRDLEAAVGDPGAKERIRQMRKRFGNVDLTSRFSAEQKAEIVALAGRLLRNQRELRRLLGEVEGRQEPKPIAEGEAGRMSEAEKKRIKKTLAGIKKAMDNPLGISRRMRECLVAQAEEAVSAVPYEKKGVCCEELSLYCLAGDAFRDAAAQLEGTEPQRAALLHERAGKNYYGNVGGCSAAKAKGEWIKAVRLDPECAHTTGKWLLGVADSMRVEGMSELHEQRALAKIAEELYALAREVHAHG